MRGGYYRPDVPAPRPRRRSDDDGLPVAWEHAIVGQSIIAGTPFEPSSLIKAASTRPRSRARPTRRTSRTSRTTASSCTIAPGGVPVLWWRSVGHTHTAFVMESFIDELAHGGGQDPVAYRRRLLAGHPRHLGVLELAAEKAGWGTPLPAGRARGIAVHESFGSSSRRSPRSPCEGGRDPRAPRRLRGRLRHRRQPATRSRRRWSRASSSASSAALYGADHLQGRPRAAVELPRLPGAAAGRDAGGRGAHRAEQRRSRAASASPARRPSRPPSPTPSPR